MWSGIVIVTICSGWLCKAVHGEEVRIPLSSAQKTEEACLAHADEVARFARLEYRWRVECEKK